MDTNATRYLNGLSNRAVNCLWNVFRRMPTKDEVRRGVTTGVLHPSNVNARALGQKTYLEIRAWLGMPLPKSPREVSDARGRLALQLRKDDWSFADIGRVFRVSKNKARSLVAHGQRIHVNEF